MNSGFITQLEPLDTGSTPVSPEKSEPLVVIKNESPESEIMETGVDDIFNTSDSKDIDIVLHTLCEGLIKNETISENIQETVFVKTENVKIVNIIESDNLIKTEDTSDDNGQEVVEVQGNLETDKLQVLNFSKDLNGISVRSPKSEHPEKTDFAECYRTCETTSSVEVNANVKVIKAPVIPVKSHEYTTLAKNNHVCNHCQLTCKTLSALKLHIRTKHREVTTMYQCLYCSFQSKWRSSLPLHMFHKHKGTRDNLKYNCDKCDYKTYNSGILKRHKLIHLKPEEIPYFHCNLCSYKSKYKENLRRHVLIHSENVENEQNLKRYRYCDKCDYKTHSSGNLKSHKLSHLKPEEIQYFDCYLCSYRSKYKENLRRHVLIHFENVEIGQNVKRYCCDKCNYKTCRLDNLKTHKLIHLKPEEIQYFHCYHCSYKCKHKISLKIHILMHFQREEIKFDCYICDFMTLKRDMIIKHLKKHFKHHTKSDEAKRKYQLESHTKIRYCDKCDFKTYYSGHLKSHKLKHLKPKEISYFYCYHCSFKSKRKGNLKTHILRHFKKEEIKFHCYICDFMTLKRNMIIKHLQKHFKHCTKSDEAKCKYQLENHTKIRYHYCDKCNYKTDTSTKLKRHKIIHLKPEEIQYFHCYHCSFKSKHKSNLKAHIFRHFKNGNVPFHCYICDFMTFKRELIIGHIKKKHSKVQIKSEINEGSYNSSDFLFHLN